MKNNMETFLSDAALSEHREYLSSLKNRAAIYSKSGIDVRMLGRGGARGGRLSFAEAKGVRALMRNIEMHELYFDSFGASFVPCDAVRKSFGSENNFAFELTRFSETADADFVCVFSDRNGKIRFCADRFLPEGVAVHLALDLCEHAYFRDYGFNRGAYLRAALAHLDFSRINGYYAQMREQGNKK